MGPTAGHPRRGRRRSRAESPAASGLQVYDDATAQKLTSLALEVGYRNFFASVLAKNQVGFARAIKESGVAREDLFICGSVLSNRVSGREAARDLSARGCRENMEALYTTRGLQPRTSR